MKQIICVRKILTDYLKENGFDGLTYPGECGCEIGDLAPCDNLRLDCEPGYKIADPTGEYDYLITTKKSKL